MQAKRDIDNFNSLPTATTFACEMQNVYIHLIYIKKQGSLILTFQMI